MPNTPVDIDNDQTSDPATLPTLDKLFGRWVLSTLNDSAVIAAGDEEANAYIEFGPPCYETGDGHCNEVFDGGPNLSERREGRLSLRGYSGCNWFGGEALLEGRHLITRDLISTERECENVMPQEISLQRILSDRPLLFIDNASLTISSETGDRIRAVSSTPAKN